MNRIGTITSATVLFFASSLAFAGKPAIFQPDTPPNWTYQQHQIANKALDVLFDTCPQINRYLANIKEYSLGFQPKKNLIPMPFAQSHHWDNVLTLNMTLMHVMPVKWTNSATPYFNGKALVAIFMGTGDAPGIWIQTSIFGDGNVDSAHEAERLICGAKNVNWIQTPGMSAFDKSFEPSADVFIPAQGMAVLDDLN